VNRSFTPVGLSIQRAVAKTGATVLVVDGDGVSRRFLELALTAGRNETDGHLSVETAKNAASAMDILHATLVDLILCEIDLPDISGLQFHRRLLQESRLRNIPFVFIASEAKIATRVAALSAGAEDILSKPFDRQELSARVESILQRHRRTREALRSRTYTLAGDFSAIAFADLVVMLEMGRKSGRLAIVASRMIGEVHVAQGQVVHAHFGNLVGVDAFRAILAEEEAAFELTPVANPAEFQVITIRERVTPLLMEAARLHDTAVATNTLPPRPRPVPREEPAPTRYAPLVPTTMLASHFEQGVSDPFALAELRLWSMDELAKWTTSPAGRDRFHVVLFADLADGCSALLSIAGAPSERFILGALREGRSAVGVAFFLRYERLLDVILVDIKSAATVQTSLLRAPALVILAPPEGDYLDVGPQARVEIEACLRNLAPRSVLGVGGESLDAAMRDMACLREASVDQRTMPGPLARVDIRGVLVAGIRLWGKRAVATTPPPAAPPVDTQRKA
jgi:DNA-binding response OmpR family regulator